MLELVHVSKRPEPIALPEDVLLAVKDMNLKPDDGSKEVFIYALAHVNDPLLTTKLEPFDFSKHTKEEVEQISLNLVATMQHYGGIGLSANQVRLPYKVFVMRGSPPFVCFNPVLVELSTETVKLEEGCLSFPGLIADINRPKHIKVRFQTPSGAFVTRTFTGMTARVIQHEMEHLDGEFFFDGIGRMRMEKALTEAEKGGHNYRQFNLMKRAVS